MRTWFIRLLPQLLFFVFVGLSIILLYLPTNGFMRNQYDDSYITYRYSINLATGNGLVFNTYERADSASSLSYTLILAAFYLCGITNLEVVAVIIGLLSAVGVSYFVYRSIFEVTKQVFVGYLFGFLIGIHGFISGWAISGMETVFFTFLVTAFIYSYFFSKKSAVILQTILLGLILLTRMEGILLIAVWFFAEIINNRTQVKQKFWMRLGSQCVVLGIIFVGIYGFKYIYYGSIVSTAVAFKRIATYYLPNPMNIIFVWGGTSFFVMVLAGYSLIHVKFKKYWSLFLYMILSGFSLFFGPHSDGARYSVHLLPIVMIFAGMGATYLYKINKHTLVVIIAVVLIVLQTLASTFVVRMYMQKLAAGQACRSALGTYVAATSSSGQFILAGDLGMVAYRAEDQEFIDISGLTSKNILSAYARKQVIDPIIMKNKPPVLVDTFFVDSAGNLSHPVLTNKEEHIKNMKIYSHLFTSQSFVDPLFVCYDGVRAYAVIDLKTLYK